MMKAEKKFRPLKSSDVCRIYELLTRAGEVSFPLTETARTKVDSLVANINGSSFGVPNYATPEEKAIAYIYFIIKNHPFVDGNKRTAFLSFRTFVTINHLEYRDSYFESEEFRESFPIYIEQTQTKDHQQLIKDLAQSLFA